jgi:hypothetical protein
VRNYFRAMVVTAGVMVLLAPVARGQEKQNPPQKPSSNEEQFLKEQIKRETRERQLRAEAQMEEAIKEMKATFGPGFPIQVHFVIAKYQGDKKVSSAPYSVSLDASAWHPGDYTSLRVGAAVPVPIAPMPAGAPIQGPVSYRDVGTKIDCRASTNKEGLFKIDIKIEDSSIYLGQTAKDASGPDKHVEHQLAPGTAPAFRSFGVNTSVHLRNGQTTQLTTAADPISGEVMRVDVTLNVVK